MQIDAKRPPARRRALAIARVLVSAGLFGFVLVRADPTKLLGYLRGVAPALLLLAIALQLAGVLISALKWWLLLRALEAHTPYAWTVRTYLIGQFFSNFLPTMIGGDAVRVYQLSRRDGRPAIAIASVLVERITGFLALTLIAWAALGLSVDRFDAAPRLRWLIVGCVSAASAALALAFSAPWTARWLMRLPLPDVASWRSRLHELAQAIERCYADRGALALVIALAFCYQVSWIVTNVVVARAIGLDAPLAFVALLVPISDIVGLVPVFFNSLGAREGTFVLLLGLIGTPAALALTFAILVFVVRLTVSLLGGALLLLSVGRGPSSVAHGSEQR
jgi:uncharacterized membrane protein YbhN (UPF0104 family)